MLWRSLSLEGTVPICYSGCLSIRPVSQEEGNLVPMRLLLMVGWAVSSWVMCLKALLFLEGEGQWLEMSRCHLVWSRTL